jgi:hypothetical protein
MQGAGLEWPGFAKGGNGFVLSKNLFRLGPEWGSNGDALNGHDGNLEALTLPGLYGFGMRVSGIP